MRAILSYPSREALAGAIDGVAGAVVGTEADLSADPPIPATWADCKTHKQQQNTSQNSPHLHSITYMQTLQSIHIMTSNSFCERLCKHTPLMDNPVFEWTWSEVIRLNKRRSQSLPPVAQLPHFHSQEWNE